MTNLPATPPALTELPRKSLKERVVEQICSAITRGELRAGDRVTEITLARKLGVSQPTIREALIELEHRGFVERRGPRKTFITALSSGDIRDLYVVRVQLEALVIELILARHITEIPQSQASYERMMTAAKAGGAEEFYHADLEFHKGLWAASGNRALADILERLVPKLFGFIQIQKADPMRDNPLMTAEQHRKILESIRSGDAAMAQATMRDSLRRAMLEDSKFSAPLQA
jgi:DNA-binding GntR family transcriptional regulator